MTTVQIAPIAERQIRRIAEWWHLNRPVASELFVDELANALELLAVSPGLGIVYAERRGVSIRRVLLPRTQYHVYFAHHEALGIVEVRAVWRAMRGRGPVL